MKTVAIVLLTFYLTTTCFSQKDNSKSWLRQKFETADSILITSHKPTAGFGLVDSLGNEVPLPKLIDGNKLNNKIVKERKFITGKAVDKLVTILDKPFKDRIISKGGCFIPRQTIFIFKSNKIDYIDLCFHCSNFETSKALSRLYEFDKKKWSKLETFFINQGLTYELIQE